MQWDQRDFSKGFHSPAWRSRPRSSVIFAFFAVELPLSGSDRNFRLVIRIGVLASVFQPSSLFFDQRRSETLPYLDLLKRTARRSSLHSLQPAWSAVSHAVTMTSRTSTQIIEIMAVVF
jgi:hypothetical protein